MRIRVEEDCNECVGVCNDILAAESASVLGPDAPASTAPTCSLCHVPTTADDWLSIPDRGVLCLECVAEVEATSAVARESQPDTSKPS